MGICWLGEIISRRNFKGIEVKFISKGSLIVRRDSEQ